MKNFILSVVLLCSFQFTTQAQPTLGETVHFTNNTDIYFVGVFTTYGLGSGVYSGNYWYDIPPNYSYETLIVVDQLGMPTSVSDMLSLAIWDFYGVIGGAKFSIDYLGSPTGFITFSHPLLLSRLLRVSWNKGINSVPLPSMEITLDII